MARSFAQRGCSDQLRGGGSRFKTQAAAMKAEEINYCPRCGNALVQALRVGRLRPVCPECDWVYFPDPKVAVAALIIHEGKVLLVRRVNEPFRGRWTLPAGFVDAGEDPAAALERECQEETGFTVRVSGLLDVIAGQEHPRGAHILIVYRAEISGGVLQPGDDVDDARFFSPYDLPPLAFQTTQKILSRLAGY